MLGFVIGTVSLFALIVTLRRGPWGRGRRFNRLARRLHASPSQEEALRSVSDELFATSRATREDAFALIEKLRAAAESDKVKGRVAESTADFFAHQVNQRPAFVLTDAIGDKAVFSALVRIEPLAATIDAMLRDTAAYAAHKTHHGEVPKQ